MTVTGLKQQIKNPDRVSVYVDSKYAFSLTLNQVVEHKIKQGQELNQTDVKKYQKISEQGKQKARALEWLMSRPHSEKEFFEYLNRKKVDSELAEQWAIEFRDKKYLNDSYFAKWWTENRRRSKLASSKKIRYELRAKGIDSAIIDNQLESTADDESEALRALIEKKSTKSKYQNNPDKLIAYLLSQGFNYSLIKELLNK